MMWSLLLITFFFKVFGALLLIILTIAIGFRLWIEPFKGVCKCKTRLHGKVALITGGNSGIGLETAKDLAKRGATVIIASRNDKKSEQAVAEIKKISGNNNIEYRNLNLAKFESIREFVNGFNKEFDRLDILVNNAECAAVKAMNTEGGIDLLMQINYVGPFLLTYLLIDKLKASKPSRVVIVSSYAHKLAAKFKIEDITRVYSGSNFIRYAYTKLCDILWTRELAKRLPEGVTANVLHPGIVLTNIFHNVHPYMKALIYTIVPLLFKNSQEGAQTVKHLCVCPRLENSTAGYYVDCKKIKPSKFAEDDGLAEKLWERTLELIDNEI